MKWTSRNLTATSTYAQPIKEIVYGVIQMAGLDLLHNAVSIDCQANGFTAGDIVCEAFEIIYFRFGTTNSQPIPPSTQIKYIPPFTTTAGTTVYPNIIGSVGHSMLRIYLDGSLLNYADWTYDSATDILSFNISITGASEVSGDYL